VLCSGIDDEHVRASAKMAEDSDKCADSLVLFECAVKLKQLT
jgi:hypothetical protein